MEIVRVAVLASGSGSNLQALLDHDLAPAKIALVIVNVPGAGAIERARQAGVPVEVIDHRSFSGREAFDARMVEVLNKARVDWVVLAGFMRLLSRVMLEAFPERIVNIHPALLPAFPGVRAQAQALAAGVRVSGCTVHLVDAGTDTGPILAQAAVPVRPGDDEEALSRRILREEHRIYPRVVKALAEGRLRKNARNQSYLDVPDAGALAFLRAPAFDEGAAEVGQHFDVVVLGGRLSSLVTAALLAKRGLRGLLVDQGELASLDPSLVYDLVHADAGSQIMETVHRELGLEDELKKRTRALTPFLQIVLPDQRFDLASDPGALLAEIGRTFGTGAAKATDTLLAKARGIEVEEQEYLLEAGELPATGFFARRAADSALRRHEALTQHAATLFMGIPPLLAEALLAPLAFITHFDARRPDEVPAARFARPILRMLRGLYRIDSPRGMRELLLEVTQSRAFEVRRTAVEAVEPGGKGAELRLVGHKERISTEVLIDASTDLGGLDTVPNKKKDLAAALQSVKPKGFLHTISVEVDAAVIPPGLAEHALLLNGRRDPNRYDAADPDAEDRPIWLSRRPATEPGRVQLVAMHPVSSARAQAQGLGPLEDIMRARLERLIPFLMEGRPEIQPLSGQGAIKHRQPVLPHPLYDQALDPRTGLTGIPASTGHKSMLIASPAVLPGLGVEGEYLAALRAADACEHLVTGHKKRKTLAPA